MKKKNNLSNILLILILIVGLSLLLYPSFSDWWNEQTQSRVIDTYAEYVADLDDDKYFEIWEAAKAYNKSLLERSNEYVLTEEQLADYYSQLVVSPGTPMGYVEIPSIGCKLPIYQGTEELTLQVAIGHIEWTSLPTGGESTHCVLSGHRGLPSAKLFTDLDQLIVGDTFLLHILGETLTYEVDQILIVEPQETEALLIEEGKDLCTLVTCTPYGINSHRMLVRGHRVENAAEAVQVRVVSDAVEIDPLIVACVIVGPILLVLVLLVLLTDRLTNRRRKRNRQAQHPVADPDDTN